MKSDRLLFLVKNTGDGRRLNYSAKNDDQVLLDAQKYAWKTPAHFVVPYYRRLKSTVLNTKFEQKIFYL